MTTIETLHQVVCGMIGEEELYDAAYAVRREYILTWRDADDLWHRVDHGRAVCGVKFQRAVHRQPLLRDGATAPPGLQRCKDCEQKTLELAFDEAKERLYTAKGMARCTKCKGAGLLKCDDCKGGGRSECHECGHLGDCQECDGDGRVECHRCDGRGWR